MQFQLGTLAVAPAAAHVTPTNNNKNAAAHPSSSHSSELPCPASLSPSSLPPPSSAGERARACRSCSDSSKARPAPGVSCSNVMVYSAVQQGEHTSLDCDKAMCHHVRRHCTVPLGDALPTRLLA